MKRILLALLVLTSITVAAQDAVLLRVNYHQGDTYQLNVESNASMGITGFMNSTMTMEMKINTVEDKLFKTETKLTSIAIDMAQGSMSMKYDTSMKAEELDDMGHMMKAQFDPMMNATIYASIDNLGTNLDTRIDPAIEGLEQFTQNAGAINYPLEKVAVGSTWTAQQEMQGMTMTIIYTVRSIADGTAILDITGDMVGTGTGTIKGNSSIDIKSGVQKNSELQLTISAQGMDVSTTVKTMMTKV
jgi:hypothetical protein